MRLDVDRDFLGGVDQDRFAGSTPTPAFAAARDLGAEVEVDLRCENMPDIASRRA